MDNTEKKSTKSEELRIKLFYGAITSLICLTGAAVFFWGGYKLGAQSTAATAAISQNYASVPTAEPAMPKPTAEKTNYTVISENGRICLYENTDGGQTLIASEPVSLELFPPSDRAELENGTDFDDLSAAQALFEDFSN